MTHNNSHDGTARPSLDDLAENPSRSASAESTRTRPGVRTRRRWSVRASESVRETRRAAVEQKEGGERNIHRRVKG